MQDCPLSILAFWQLRGTFYISYNDAIPEFILISKTNNSLPPLVFSYRRGHFRYDFEETQARMGKMALLVAPGGECYTPAELKAAHIARHLHVNMGHPNDHALGILLDTNGVADTTATSSALRQAVRILGPCPDCVTGKITHWSSNISTQETQNLPAQRIGQRIYVDILFLHVIPFLIAFDGYSSFLLGCRIQSKSTPHLCDGLDRILAYFKARKYITDEVIADHEKAFKATELHLATTHHAVLRLKSPGHHNRRIERLARYIRAHERVIIGALPFLLALIFHEPLVSYIIIRRNVVPVSATGTLSPIAILNPGYRPSAKVTFRLKFGDMVICKVPTIARGEELPGEEALFLYPVPMESYALVYVFKRAETRITDGFVFRDMNPRLMVQIAITDDHILRMNALAERNKGSVNDSLLPYLDPIFPETARDRQLRHAQEEDHQDELLLPRSSTSAPPPDSAKDHHMIDVDSPPDQAPATAAVQPTTPPPAPTPLSPSRGPVDPTSPPSGRQVRFEEIYASPTRPMLNNPIRLSDRLGSTMLEPTQHSAVETHRPSPLATAEAASSPTLPIPVLQPASSPLPPIPEAARPDLPPSQIDDRPPATGSNASTSSPALRRSTRNAATSRIDYSALHSRGARNTVLVAQLSEAKQKLRTTLAGFDKWTHRRIEANDFFYAGLATTLKKALRELPDAVQQAVHLEFENVFTLKKCILPVDYTQLTQAQRHLILYSFMFLTEKWTATGDFDKLKARLAAGGDQQDPTNMTVDPSAPTVDFLTVQVILSLIALNRMHTAVLDVRAAFLNADLDEEAYICLDADCTRIFVEMFPQFAKWVRPNGTLVCKVLKALYGMLQSAKLWYNHLRTTLEALDFIAVDLGDKCLFYRVNQDGSFSYILVYVDDLFIAASTLALLEMILTELTKAYGEVTIQRGPKFSYLGMTIEFSADRSSFTQSQHGYQQALLEEFQITGIQKSPSPRSFMEAPTGLLALPCDGKLYRRKLMRTAYLALRTRTDLKFYIQILATRTQSPTQHDMSCLDHLLQYINYTSAYYTRIKPSDANLVVYADASFCVHPDARGVSGIWIQMGLAPDCGPIYVQSSKQKLIGNHSTACEIIAVDDMLYTLHQIITLKTAVNAPSTQPAILQQDNESAITIMNTGRPSAKRSKYMTVRFQHIFEALTVDELITTRWCPTEDMIADLLTKPLYGQQLVDLTRRCLNMPSQV